MPGSHLGSRERLTEQRGSTKSLTKPAGETIPSSTEFDSRRAESIGLSPTELSSANVLRLQRTIGNQAVGRLLSASESIVRPEPSRPSDAESTIHRSLFLNNQEKTKAEDARADLGADFDAMQGTIQELIALPGAPVKVTTAELKEVHAFQTQQAMPQSRAAKVAILQLVSHGAWTHTATTGLKSKPTLDVFNTPRAFENIKKLGEFLARNPNVGENLAGAGVGWALMSGHKQLNNMGGGAVIEDRVHIAAWVLNEQGEGFMRMVVHETGHATFQRMLLTGENWSDDADKGDKVPDDRALVEDGKKFYQAWEVLRKKPQYFFITDMPGGSAEATGAGRGGYLAGRFSEFCAESFMQLALEKGALQAHVNQLPDKENDVKAAWQSALAVLLKYESQILGKDAPGGKETLASHRRTQEFIAVLQKLNDGLKGPELEPVNLDLVKGALEAVRGAWQGLTDSERAQHRGAALTTLDQYLMKVQRRRPAQANLGSELGFAGL